MALVLRTHAQFCVHNETALVPVGFRHVHLGRTAAVAMRGIDLRVSVCLEDIKDLVHLRWIDHSQLGRVVAE